MGAYVTPQELGSRFLGPDAAAGASAPWSNQRWLHKGEENVEICRENVDL